MNDITGGADMRAIIAEMGTAQATAHARDLELLESLALQIEAQDQRLAAEVRLMLATHEGRRQAMADDLRTLARQIGAPQPDHGHDHGHDTAVLDHERALARPASQLRSYQ